jgi:hypothetical protein
MIIRIVGDVFSPIVGAGTCNVGHPFVVLCAPALSLATNQYFVAQSSAGKIWRDIECETICGRSYETSCFDHMI